MGVKNTSESHGWLRRLLPSGWTSRRHAARDDAANIDTMSAQPVRWDIAATSAPNPLAAATAAPQRGRSLTRLNPEGAPAAEVAAGLLAAMRGSFEERQAVVAVLLRLRGPTLRAVKERLEVLHTGALFEFVYNGGCCNEARAQLLEHMATQVPAGDKPLYILSDIDNTYCPTRDSSYEGSVGTYPGQCALYASLIGCCGDARQRLTFLTARFGERVLPVAWLSSRTRRRTTQSLRDLNVDRPSVLYGSMRYMPYVTRRGIDMSPLGTKKLINFERMIRLFPEFRYVFFGDSCEDDLRVGTEMRQKFPDQVAAVFIHDFDGVCGKRVSPEAREAARAARVIFYRSVPDAAFAAHTHEADLGVTMDADAVRRVMAAARDELQKRSFRGDPLAKAHLQSQLEREIGRIDAALSTESTLLRTCSA